MEINTLKGIQIKDIVNVFNESFSDYFIPFQLSIEQLKSKMLADKVNLDVSVGVFENGNLIAFILHGYDTVNNEKVIYNGGTGVVPKRRGLGLTKQMYNFILPVLKKKGINRLLLEVITENKQAIKSYEKSGYIVERELLCYKGEINISNIDYTLDTHKLHDYNWNLMQSFWDISPTWQNSNIVLNEFKDTNISLGAYFKNQLVGYIIYNPNSKRLQQIAISKKFRRRKIASTLIFKLIEEYGDSFSILNVDKSSKAVNLFFQKIGFIKNLEQLEMGLKLDESSN